MTTSAPRLGALAAAVAALAAFLPWATVSVELVGVRFSGVRTAKGTEIGSVAGLSYGWILVVLALATLLAFARPSAWLLLLGALTGGFGLYAMFAASHQVLVVPAADGAFVNALLQPHVARRFGLYLEGLAAVTVLATAVAAFRSSRASGGIRHENQPLRSSG